MTNSQRLESIRQHLEAWFDAKSDMPVGDMAESILIRNGFYCGKKFQLPGFQAVWFAEEDEVKIYQEDGQLAASFTGEEICEGSEPEVASYSISSKRPQVSSNENGMRRAA